MTTTGTDVVSAHPDTAEGMILRMPEPWPSIWRAESVLRSLAAALPYTNAPRAAEAERGRLILSAQIQRALAESRGRVDVPGDAVHLCRDNCAGNCTSREMHPRARARAETRAPYSHANAIGLALTEGA